MESKNIIIRESVFEDCELFYKWENDPAVEEFFTFDKPRLSLPYCLSPMIGR